MQNVLQKKSPPPQSEKIDVIDKKYVRPVVHEKKEVHHQPKVHREQNKYLRFLPILLLGLICYAITGAILFFVEPAKIQSIVVTNSYFPLVFISFLAHFFFFTYFFLNARRGLFISLILTFILFLRLQQVFSPLYVGIFAAPLLLIESILTVRRHLQSD